MTDQDKPAFLDLYAQIQEFYGREPSPKVAGMWWQLARRETTLEEFTQATLTHFRTCKFAPQLSELLELVRTSKWPSPQDAWNQVPKSEAETGWLCAETAAALAACQDSIDRGDMIGARMAFLERYCEVLKHARGEPQWWISESSLGDYETRQAQRAKLIQAHPSRRPALTDQTIRQEGQMIGSERTARGLQHASEISRSIAVAKSR